jgi:hypothetical protein
LPFQPESVDQTQGSQLSSEALGFPLVDVLAPHIAIIATNELTIRNHSIIDLGCLCQYHLGNSGPMGRAAKDSSGSCPGYLLSSFTVREFFELSIARFGNA